MSLRSRHLGPCPRWSGPVLSAPVTPWCPESPSRLAWAPGAVVLLASCPRWTEAQGWQGLATLKGKVLVLDENRLGLQWRRASASKSKGQCGYCGLGSRPGWAASHRGLLTLAGPPVLSRHPWPGWQATMCLIPHNCPPPPPPSASQLLSSISLCSGSFLVSLSLSKSYLFFHATSSRKSSLAAST